MSRPFREGQQLVKTYVPDEVATALEALVALSGASRAAVLRHLIVTALSHYALVSAEVAEVLPVTTYNTAKERA